MEKLIVWRTDGQAFNVGALLVSRGDHMTTLAANHLATEQALRAGLPNGHHLRATSLYTWRDEDWARHTWAFQSEKYLYELALDPADERHRGDVNYYTDLETDVAVGLPGTAYIAAYAHGDPHDPRRHSRARTEILIAKAIVIARHDPPH